MVGGRIFFDVQLAPLYTIIDGKQVKVPGKAVFDMGLKRVIATVSDDYQLVTHKEAITLGKKVFMELLGTDSEKDIEIFRVYAPWDGASCIIDLVHKTYSMNLYGLSDKPEIYLPYMRITNSYNKRLKLGFYVGFYREICLNGVIFKQFSKNFSFCHLRKEFANLDEVSRIIKREIRVSSMEVMFRNFSEWLKVLKSIEVSTEDACEIVKLLFNIREVKEIETTLKLKRQAKSDRHSQAIEEHEDLLGNVRSRIFRNLREIGENAYGLFNAITDIASRPPRSFYFKRQIPTLQRLAGEWLLSFYRYLKKTPDFDIKEYIQEFRNTGVPPLSSKSGIVSLIDDDPDRSIEGNESQENNTQPEESANDELLVLDDDLPFDIDLDDDISDMILV